VTVNNQITLPVISNVTAGSITSSGATIAWSTDKACDSQVAYGTTAAYGSTTTLNSLLVTSHSANLSGLAASTTYHYQVLSRDAQGNLASSADYSFTTTTVSQGPQALLQLHLDSSEINGLTNGSVVTPSTAPAGFTGAVVVNGAGSLNFTPAELGNGVYFLNCCQVNSGYLTFTYSTRGRGNAYFVPQGTGLRR